MDMRVGIGYDAHPLVEQRKLILGGVEIPSLRGLLGHSDADVLTHAVIDALLGAAGLGDIGVYFPASDPKFKDISSLQLLSETKRLLRERGFEISNIDATVVAERPKLLDFLKGMRLNIARVLEVDEEKVNIKGKRPEGLGFCGREEGIEAFCVVLIRRNRK